MRAEHEGDYMTNANMLISVLIPFTDESKDIERSIESVCRQDYQENCYEIIILNGCGKVAERRLLNVEEKYQDSVVLITQEDEVQSKCNLINSCLSFVKGEYVLFLNSGDELNLGLFSAIEWLSNIYSPDIISYGMTLALDCFEYFRFEPFDKDGFEVIRFDTSDKRKRFMTSGIIDERFMCSAYNSAFLRGTNYIFGKDALDDDVIFTFPTLFNASTVAHTGEHGYCRYQQGSDIYPSRDKIQKRIMNRMSLELEMYEAFQSDRERYSKYKDVIDAHFFREFYLKNLRIAELSNFRDVISAEIFQFMKYACLKLLAKWYENPYISGFGRREIDRISYLFNNDLGIPKLEAEFGKDSLVSVIIATYNRSSDISRSIQCILSQTWRRLELIVIDDGSDDDTEDIVRSFSDDRLKYIKNPKNMGVSYSRNRGLREAKGDFIVYQDDDDMCRLDKIEKQISFMRNQPLEIAMTYCATINHNRAISGITDVPSEIMPRDRRRNGPCSGFIFPRLLQRNFVPCTAMIMRKTVFENVGIFDEELFAYEDWDLIIRIAQKYDVIFMEEILYDYYQRKGTLSSGRDPEHRGKVLRALQTIDQKYKKDRTKYGVESKFVVTEG